MTSQPRVIVLRTAGTNCDGETVFAFERCGADVSLVHINRVLSGEVNLRDFHILAIPGGFSYGDDIISGRILANELRLRLGESVRRFIDDGKLIIGICNGFQVLTRAGILPGPDDNETIGFKQNVSLTHNDSGKFEDRWIHLKLCGRSVWTEGLSERIYLPVAHAEGKFVPRDQELLEKMKSHGQVVLRYCSSDGGTPVYPDNPNGSVDDVAGVSDRTGRILGLMPHPERHFLFIQHPFWTRLPRGESGDGARIFENGVNYIRKNFVL